MTSGKTDKELTREEKIEMLFQYQYKAAVEFQKADEAFRFAAKNVVGKLQKEGISTDEFAKYCINREGQMQNNPAI